MEEKFIKYFNNDKNIEGFYNLIKITASKKTLETYMYALVEFFEYCKNNNINIYNLSEISLDNFISEANKSPSTIHTYFFAIKKYIEYLNKNGFNIKLNVTEIPKISRIPRDSLTDKQVKEFISIVLYNKKHFPEPYKTALLILPYTGLRINECISLKLSDVSKMNNILFLKVVGKGDKYREIPILQDGQIILARYLSGWRNEFFKKSPETIYLFPKNYRNHITYSNVYKKIKMIAKSMNTLITPHTFRATYATKLSNSGVNTITIMKILGHSSYITTLMYDRPKIDEIFDRIKNINY